MNTLFYEKPAEELILNIDYQALRSQKELLLLLVGRSSTLTEAALLEGVVHLIDSLQDCAVDDLGMREEIVFGENFKNI